MRRSYQSLQEKYLHIQEDSRLDGLGHLSKIADTFDLIKEKIIFFAFVYRSECKDDRDIKNLEVDIKTFASKILPDNNFVLYKLIYDAVKCKVRIRELEAREFGHGLRYVGDPSAQDRQDLPIYMDRIYNWLIKQFPPQIS